MEEITFRFSGGLSDDHLLDFYEAGRFQYGAARLMVKLDQFRMTGRFSSRITTDNKTKILLRTHDDGSFLISSLVPFLQAGGDAFLQANIGLLWSFVADRVLKRASTDNVREALATQRELLRVYDANIAQQGETNRRTLDLLEDRIARTDDLNDQNRRLYERLLAERDRSSYLEGQADLLKKITPEQDAKLVSMASPLLKDMGVALRTSASALQVHANDNDGVNRNIIFMNRRMAQDVELEKIDDQSTLLLVRLVQYNTETGWGKLRPNSNQVSQGLLSFNVPSDLKERLQADILREMNHQDSYIECQFARTPQGLVQRAIVRAIRNIEDIENMW